MREGIKKGKKEEESRVWNTIGGEAIQVSTVVAGLSATGSLCFSTLIVPSSLFALSCRGLSPDGPRRQAKDIEFIPGDDWPHATMVETAGCGLSVRYKRDMSRKMAVKGSFFFFPFFFHLPPFIPLSFLSPFDSPLLPKCSTRRCTLRCSRSSENIFALCQKVKSTFRFL